MSRARRHVLLTEYRAWMLDFKGWAQTTRSNYFRAVNLVDKRLETKGRSILVAREHDLTWAISRSPATPITRNNIRTALVSFYDFLAWRGLREDNPARGLPRLRQPRYLPRPANMLAVLTYLEAASLMGPKFLAFAVLGPRVGLRISEAVSLAWPDVEATKVRIMGKGMKVREVAITPWTYLALHAWREECPSATWVFPGIRGHVDVRTGEGWHHQIIDRAGVEYFRFHQLRHRFGTEALRASGGAIRSVQLLMGHEDISTTALYTQVENAELAEIVKHMYQETLFPDPPAGAEEQDEEAPGDEPG